MASKCSISRSGCIWTTVRDQAIHVNWKESEHPFLVRGAVQNWAGPSDDEYIRKQYEILSLLEGGEEEEGGEEVVSEETK